MRMLPLLAVLALPSPAIAQLSPAFPEASRAAEIKKVGSSSGDAARSTMNAFARCMLKSRRNLVMTWLHRSPDQVGTNEALHEIMYPRCLDDGRLQFQGNIFRGSVFTSLYQQEFGRKAPQLTPVAVSAEEVPIAGQNPTFQQFSTQLQFADCVVRRDPQSAREIVLGKPGSPEEREHFQRLATQFPLCLANGSQMKFSKTVLAGLVAEALYQASGLRAVPRTGVLAQ